MRFLMAKLAALVAPDALPIELARAGPLKLCIRAVFHPVADLATAEAILSISSHCLIVPNHGLDFLHALFLLVPHAFTYGTRILFAILTHGEYGGRHITVLLGMPGDLAKWA
jgi:hypothetical protein